ncbi:hypothetical protein [Rheinheimera sp. D18]|nr:hypothetical protein [Rheinheimera sp. D18]
MEYLHFFDDERQISIAASTACWTMIQKLANETAKSEGAGR